MSKKILLLFVILLLLSASFAHSGRTDSKGGHYDRSTGEYHYHHGKPAHTICGANCPYLPKNSKTSIATVKDWTFDTLCGLALCCLFLGFATRFFIFLPLLAIDYFFKKEFYEKFVITHSFISSVLAAIPFFLYFYLFV